MKPSEIERTDVAEAVREVIGQQVIRAGVAQLLHVGVDEHDHEDPHRQRDARDESEAPNETHPRGGVVHDR